MMRGNSGFVLAASLLLSCNLAIGQTINQGGLEWTASDNGSGISWDAAVNWCKQRGAGWRLPTTTELQSIYDSKAPPTTPCGPYHCRVSGAFKLSAAALWTGEREGSIAYFVMLVNGTRGYAVLAGDISGRFDQHALCVRKP